MRKKSGITIWLSALFLSAVLWAGQSSAASARYHGQKLTGDARKIYDIMTGFDLSSSSGTKKADDTYRIEIPFSASKEDIIKADAAFFYDFREAYWIWYFKYDALSFPPRIVLTSVERYNGASEDLSAVDKALDQAVKESNRGSTRYAKVKSIHDYILRIGHTPFFAGQNTPEYSIAGLLLDKFSHEGVCDAYASLFQILCTRCGIPCLFVSGQGVIAGSSGAHAWNYVQMDNGKWYLVDTTFDENGNLSNYDFFLKGSRSTKNDHFPDKNAGGPFNKFSYQPEIQWPSLAAADYKPSKKEQKSANALVKHKKGELVYDIQNNTVFRITKSKSTVAIVSILDQGNGASSITDNIVIPDKVVLGGVKYKVTEILPNAYAGLKNMIDLTIGSNVAKIGKRAFYKCSNLHTIRIRSAKLSSGKVGSQAFKGVLGAQVLVPYKYQKAYSKWLPKKGIPKSARIVGVHY